MRFPIILLFLVIFSSLIVVSDQFNNPIIPVVNLSRPISPPSSGNSSGGNSSFNQSLTDSLYVPYTGATANINIGGRSLTTLIGINITDSGNNHLYLGGLPGIDFGWDFYSASANSHLIASFAGYPNSPTLSNQVTPNYGLVWTGNTEHSEIDNSVLVEGQPLGVFNIFSPSVFNWLYYDDMDNIRKMSATFDGSTLDFSGYPVSFDSIQNYNTTSELTNVFYNKTNPAKYINNSNVAFTNQSNTFNGSINATKFNGVNISSYNSSHYIIQWVG